MRTFAYTMSGPKRWEVCADTTVPEVQVSRAMAEDCGGDRELYLWIVDRIRTFSRGIEKKSF